MRARLAAGLLALVILVTGAIPAVAGYRCIATGMPMPEQSACCRHRDEPGTTAFKAPCCEPYAAPNLEARRTPPVPETLVHAPPVLAWIVAPPAVMMQSQLARSSAPNARGRPLGELLHRFSSILRV